MFYEYSNLQHSVGIILPSLHPAFLVLVQAEKVCPFQKQTSIKTLHIPGSGYRCGVCYCHRIALHYGFRSAIPSESYDCPYCSNTDHSSQGCD